MQNPGLLAVLHNRHFLFLWLAQAISQTAQNIVNFSLMVEVETLTRSSTAVSLIILSFAVPAVIFSAIAGVFVDRTDKKLVLLTTNGLRGAVVLGYLLAQPSWSNVQLIVFFGLITFAFSTISQFFGPAEGSMIPLLVHRSELIAANSLFNLTFIGSQLVGFALLGPVLILIIGPAPLFGVVCVLYLICVGLVLLLPKKQAVADGAPVKPNGRSLGQVWGDLSYGWKYILKDRAIVVAILHLSLSTSLFLMLAAIGPGFMTRVIGIGARDFGFLLVPGGFGMMIGVLVVNRLAPRLNRELMINLAVGAFGVILLLLGLLRPATNFVFGLFGQSTPVNAYLLSVMGLGLAFGVVVAMISIPAQTVLQERSSESVRGRVLAAFFMASNAFSVVPILFAGAIGDLIGIVQVMLLIGLLALSASAVGLYLFHRSMPAPGG